MRLSTRLVVRASLVVAAAVTSASLLTYQLVNYEGRNDLDDLLRDEAALLTAELATLLPDAAGLDGVLTVPEIETAARAALTRHPSGTRHVPVVVVQRGGEVVRLYGDGGPPEIAALVRGDATPVITPGLVRTVDTDAGPVRVLSRMVLDEAGADLARIDVLASLDDVRESASTVLRRSALAGLAGVLLGAAALWWVVRRSLRPLEDVSHAAAGITSHDLTTRVPVPATQDEVADLAGELNRMLDRIEHDHLTRRRYVAAISHEVRTPLAVAQGHLELLESLGPADADDVRRTSAVVRRELDRLRRVLDDLIAANRGEASMAVRQETVFAPDLLDALRERVAALPHAARVVIDPAPPVVLIADQSRLEQCIANLIDNAIVHGTDTTAVSVRSFVDRQPEGTGLEHLVVDVSDDGPGIAPELLPRVFDPYVSTRPDRSSGTAGLGLAVVRSLVEALGGSVTARSSSAGTVMSIRLPLASADGSAVVTDVADVTDDVSSRLSRP